MKPLTTSSKVIPCLTEWIAIFNGDKTITGFVNQVELMAEEKFPNAHLDEREKNKLNSFKGDMLEVLAEIFFGIYSSHPAVGIAGYTSVPLAEDYGVDGIGTNVNGDKCAVQVKYRANPLEEILYPDMAKTYSAGREVHNLLLDKNDTLFLFTTGAGVTSACQSVFKNKIRVINRKIISGIIDGNQNFWQDAEEMIMVTLDNLTMKVATAV